MSVRNPSYLLKKSYSFYVRIRIPSDIKARFRNRTELRFSLRTNKVTDAKSKARLVAGLLQWVFRNIKNGGCFSVISDKELNKLVKDYVEKLLEEDEKFWLESPKVAPKDELGWAAYDSILMEKRGRTLEQLLNYDFSDVTEEAETILVDAGHKVPKGSLTFNTMCQKLLQGLVHYYDVMAERASGEHLITEIEDVFKNGNSKSLEKESASEIKAIPNVITMEDLAEAFWNERSENWKEGAKKNYRTYQKRILEFFSNDAVVGEIDYYKCKEFRDKLRHSRTPPLSPKKVNDYLDYFKGMLNFEIKTTRNLTFNPAEGLHLKDTQDKQDKTAPFDLNDLELMFVKSKDYGHDKFRDAHMFWIPLVGLYTGARLEEICQAVKSDIVNKNGVWVIDINEVDEQKSVKTGKRRVVPIHSFLIELGFHRYVQKLKDGSRLWPKLTYVQNRWSHYYGRQFKNFKDSAGIDKTPRYKTFHSFRHTVSDQLKHQMVMEVYVAEFLGHQHSGISYGTYGGKTREQTLLENVVEKLDFHEKLNFNHLKKSKFART